MDRRPSDLTLEHVDSAFRTLLDQSRDCVKIVSLDGALTYMNPNGQKAMQIDDFNRVAGRKWSGVWPKESQGQVEAAVRRAAAGFHSRFEALCPTAKGEDRWWDVSVSPILDGHERVTHIISTSRDVTHMHMAHQHDIKLREAAEARAELQNIVASETRHRLKNVLTIVSALSNLVGRGSTTVEEFLARFSSHLKNLGAAQDLLARAPEGSVFLRETIASIVESNGRDERIEVRDKAEAVLTDRNVQSLALILGELMTNAIKYGALSRDDGRLTLTSDVSEKFIDIHWVEDCGETLPEPELDGGTGLSLIRRLLGAEGKDVRIGWNGRGLDVRFSLSTD